MASLNEYAQWYYAIYVLPGGLALLFLLLSALNGRMHHGQSGGGGHGLGHQAHLHQAHPHQAHPHQAHPHQAHPHQGASPSRTPFLAAFLRVGRVPAPLLWGSGLLGWGVFGFWGTQFWQSFLHLPAAFALPALATALAGALVTEKVTVEAAFRFLPSDETFAISAVELCGLTGTVVFPTDTLRGRIHVYDAHGTLHDVSARTVAGQETLVRGCTVLVADYDAVGDQMIVEAAP